MILLAGLAAFLVILAFLILVHELGHFLTAKAFGVRVQEFGLGFPPRLKGWCLGGTVYSINAIPLGGFVRMLGENGEANEPDSFGAKPPWQRVLILAAGPSMNIAIAIAIFFVAGLTGSPRGLTIITAVQPHSPAAAARLHAGDRIVAINGRRVTYFDQLRAIEERNLGKRITLRVRRHSRLLSVSLVPRANPAPGQGSIGIGLNDTVTVHYGPRQSFSQALGEVGTMVASVPIAIQSIGQHGPSAVQGPVGIAQDTTQVVKTMPTRGLGTLFAFAALLSANLGVLNLLPIPALDGGRMVFAIIAWLRRRNLDPRVEGMIHLAGMAALLLFILLVSYQDLLRWVAG